MKKDWDPDDPVLNGIGAHEPPGVLRWHRANVPSKQLMELLRLRGSQLIKALEEATQVERKAVMNGRPIHDALIPKEETS